MIDLTTHQQDALAFLTHGIADGQRLLALRGLAGTGKTVCIGPLKKALETATGRLVDVGAPTHRAAVVLRSKGLLEADTVQSLAMRPRFTRAYREARSMLGAYDDEPDDDADPVEPVAYADTGDGLIAESQRTWMLAEGFPSEDQMRQRAGQFGIAKTLRSIGIDARDHFDGYGPKRHPGGILLLDEASMVGREMLDLCQQAYPHVILVGDPGQLPPVKDVAVLHTVPGVTLDDVHRQAAESSILRLAYAARGGTVRWHRGDLRAYAPDVCAVDYAPAARLCDVPVLVWRNSTRLEVTRAVRARLGYAEGALYPGEPLVCRSTDRADRLDGFYNNALFRIVDVLDEYPGQVWVVPDGEPEAVRQRVTVHMEEYDGPYVEPGAMPFRFGYALTVHTAQGGEWPMVVIDQQDLLAQRGMCYARKELDDAARWQYTAITRAKQTLLLLQQRRFT